MLAFKKVLTDYINENPQSRHWYCILGSNNLFLTEYINENLQSQHWYCLLGSNDLFFMNISRSWNTRGEVVSITYSSGLKNIKKHI